MLLSYDIVILSLLFGVHHGLVCRRTHPKSEATVPRPCAERCGKPNEFLPQLQLLTETKNRKGPCTYVGAA